VFVIHVGEDSHVMVYACDTVPKKSDVPLGRRVCGSYSDAHGTMTVCLLVEEIRGWVPVRSVYDSEYFTVTYGSVFDPLRYEESLFCFGIYDCSTDLYDAFIMFLEGVARDYAYNLSLSDVSYGTYEYSVDVSLVGKMALPDDIDVLKDLDYFMSADVDLFTAFIPREAYKCALECIERNKEYSDDTATIYGYFLAFKYGELKYIFFPLGHVCNDYIYIHEWLVDRLPVYDPFRDGHFL